MMLAGPSSSEKNTSANRLATHCVSMGKKPILMSLDDYYIDPDKIAPGPDGKLDFGAYQPPLTRYCPPTMAQLLAGKGVELPSFNFLTGRREWKGRR